MIQELHISKSDEGVVNSIPEITSWLKRCITHLGISDYSISYVLVSTQEIININNSALKHNYATDIITFNLTEEDVSKTLVAEMVVCPEVIKKNALDLKVPYDNEFRRVLIHGILHLCGYDDKSEEQRREMRKKENWFLEMI